MNRARTLLSTLWSRGLIGIGAVVAIVSGLSGNIANAFSGVVGNSLANA